MIFSFNRDFANLFGTGRQCLLSVIFKRFFKKKRRNSPDYKNQHSVSLAYFQLTWVFSIFHLIQFAHEEPSQFVRVFSRIFREHMEGKKHQIAITKKRSVRDDSDMSIRGMHCVLLLKEIHDIV